MDAPLKFQCPKCSTKFTQKQADAALIVLQDSHLCPKCLIDFIKASVPALEVIV